MVRRVLSDSEKRVVSFSCWCCAPLGLVCCLSIRQPSWQVYSWLPFTCSKRQAAVLLRSLPFWCLVLAEFAFNSIYGERFKGKRIFELAQKGKDIRKQTLGANSLFWQKSCLLWHACRVPSFDLWCFCELSISKIIATLCYIYSIKLHSVRMVSLALHHDPQYCYVAQPISGIVFIQASQYFPKLLPAHCWFSTWHRPGSVPGSHSFRGKGCSTAWEWSAAEQRPPGKTVALYWPVFAQP